MDQGDLLGRYDLDLRAARGCEIPGCKHDHAGKFYLAGSCHRNTHCTVSYEPNSGILLVACAKCNKEVARIHVGDGYPIAEEIGATGKNVGIMGPGDRGHLRSAVSVDHLHRNIVLNFGAMLSWVAMTEEQAKSLAEVLVTKAKQLED